MAHSIVGCFHFVRWIDVVLATEKCGSRVQLIGPRSIVKHVSILNEACSFFDPALYGWINWQTKIKCFATTLLIAWIKFFKETAKFNKIAALVHTQSVVLVFRKSRPINSFRNVKFAHITDAIESICNISNEVTHWVRYKLLVIQSCKQKLHNKTTTSIQWMCVRVFK